MFDALHHSIKASVDIGALGVIVGSWSGHLPEWCAAISGVYYIIQIGEWAYNKYKLWQK